MAEPVLEVALLDVRPGQEPAFEDAFRKAQAIISSMPGYRSHELQRCLERVRPAVFRCSAPAVAPATARQLSTGKREHHWSDLRRALQALTAKKPRLASAKCRWPRKSDWCARSSTGSGKHVRYGVSCG